MPEEKYQMVSNDPRFPIKTQIFTFLILFSAFSTAHSQEKKAVISFEVKNTQAEPIKGSEIKILSTDHTYSISTNDKGLATASINPGQYTIEIKKNGIIEYIGKIIITKPEIFTFSLADKINSIEEVIITAKESKGFTSSSVISQKAMQHLQPSSFTDLLELLPGGRSGDPVLNQMNKISLRETGNSGNDYNTSAMGTAFLVDGAPLNSSANLQYTYDFLDKSNNGLKRRLNITSGVDMRSISTDQIEKVEILRGIPSVIYGNLTSGIVKITNKSGYTPWKSRFKADGYSKLFAVSKGFEDKERNLKINAGIDYLNAKSDPRDRLENYKRITANFALVKEKQQNHGTFRWQTHLSYTGSLDGSKTDPDVDLSQLNSYEVNNHLLSLSNVFNYTKNKPSFYRSTEIQATINQRFDKIKQTKFIQLENAMAFPLSRTEGEYDGYYPQAQYISDYTVDGKPLDIFVKMVNNFQWDFKTIKNEINAGFDWQLSKNWGQGQLFDIYKPIDPKATFRPRPYRDVPAYSTAALFLETISTKNLGQHQLALSLGLRGNSMLNLPTQFTMNGKVYLDPRINLQWSLPEFKLMNKKTQIALTLGYGKQSLFPDLNLLYPELIYKDIQQLNYFHSDPNYRRVNYKTLIYNPQNPEIEPAINEKFEARIDFGIGLHQLSVTVFKEKMHNAFRTMNEYAGYQYKKYDTSALNHETITSPPDVTTLPYQLITENFMYSSQRNGSKIDKEGVEFQYSSNRIPVINTRFTLSGAWFRTQYGNSLPVYRRPDILINGRPYPYLGLYNGMEPNSVNEILNTNLMMDTYIPKLDLIFSTSFQFSWYSMRKLDPMNGTPSHYVDQNGTLLPYNPDTARGTILERLMMIQNEDRYNANRRPLEANVNLKVTKSFRHKTVIVSMFANRLFSYYAPYSVNGITISRKGAHDPYFGMEINFNL